MRSMVGVVLEDRVGLAKEEEDKIALAMQMCGWVQAINLVSRIAQLEALAKVGVEEDRVKVSNQRLGGFLVFECLGKHVRDGSLRLGV